MTAAMILCAGLGTRLAPLTRWIAKPMVPVGDAPAVEHVARALRRAGLERPVVNVHHRPDDLRSWAGDVGAIVSEEPVLLGTAGGLGNARALLGAEDVLVWNGDILSDLDPSDLLADHRSFDALATLAVIARPAGTGNVGLHGDRVVRLRSESFGEEAEGGEFLGIHVVSGTLRTFLPERGCLVGDVYLPALRRGANLRAHRTSASFVDIGDVGSYVAANRAWLAGRASWVAPDARVNADVTGSVVGARARVDAATTSCVVWPDAHVSRAFDGAIITPFGEVTPGTAPARTRRPR